MANLISTCCVQKANNIWEKYAQELVMGCALVCVLCRYLQTLPLLPQKLWRYNYSFGPALNDDLTHWHLFGVMCITQALSDMGSYSF